MGLEFPSFRAPKQKETTVEANESLEIPWGYVRILPRGFGLATVPRSTTQIFIKPEHLGTAFSGDRVSLKNVRRKENGRFEGEVGEVVERKHTEFVGSFEGLDKRGNPIIHSRKVNRTHPRFRLTGKPLPKNIKEGTQLILRIEKWDDSERAPEVSFVKTLGINGEYKAELEAIPYEHGFRDDFPDEVMAEAEALAKQDREITPEILEKEHREDFRDITTFTIDPKSARDYDDAISLEKLSNGNYQVGVHIADPTHYVKPGSAIDQEAQKRGVSVYLPDRVIPMLPEVLSNDLCSLNEAEDKRTFSIVFEITKEGKIIQKKTRITKAAINSNKRLTYQEAQQLIDKQHSRIKRLLRREKDDPLEKELKTLWDLTANMREHRTGQDIDESRNDRDELEFSFEEDGGDVKGVSVKERFNTMKMIEELMLLANRATTEAVTKAIKEHNGQDGNDINYCIYRVHPKPDPQKVEEFEAFLADLGLPSARRKHWLTKQPHEITQRDIDNVLRMTEGTEEEKAVRSQALRMMHKAMYSTDNIGHFGLNIDPRREGALYRFTALFAANDTDGGTAYGHFSSPIRRYADFILHRLISAHILGTRKINPKRMQQYVEDTVTLSNRTVAADDAERDACELVQARYIEKHKDQPRRGRIQNIDERGLHIIDRSTGTYGLLPASELGPDWKFYEKPRRYVHVKTKQQYRVETGIRGIQAKEVDLAKRRILWKFASNDNEPETAGASSEATKRAANSNSAQTKKAA